MLSEISHTEKDKYCIILTYMWNLRKIKKKTKQKQAHRYGEQMSGCQRGGGRGVK